jgi:hypothetical protein
LIDLDKLSNEEIWDSKKIAMAVRQIAGNIQIAATLRCHQTFLVSAWFQHGKTMGKNTENPPWMIHAVR